MEAVARSPVRLGWSALRRFDAGNFAAWLVPAALVVYLALENGGYGPVERGQIGLLAWWVVLAGTVVGALPVAGGTRAGRVMLGLLALFAGWTLLSFGWTESDERTSLELARVAAYLGVFALALSIQGGERWRPLFNGLATGVAIVCGLAVLSRLEPSMFPERITGQYLPGIEIESRLAYPLNYSSGLGALAAISLPLLLTVAGSARTLAGQALGAAAIPISALTLWLTTSSLSVPVAAIGILGFLLLSADRVPKLATVLVSGAGSAILLAAAAQRDALDRGLVTEAAQREGDELLAIVLVVCTGVALIQVGIGLAARYGHRPAWMHVSRPQAGLAAGAALFAVIFVALLAGLPGAISDKVDEFKGQGEAVAPAESSRGSQLLDVSSSGRYQFWESAVDANQTDPLKGIGPGTFEFWWSRNGLYPGFVRDAHSLYMETLAELGIVGLVLIAAFGLGVLGLGVARVLRAPPELRPYLAGATTACACFLAAAAVDWVWELGVLPVVFLGCAAIVVVAGRAAPPARHPSRSRSRSAIARYRPYAARSGMALLSLGAIVAIALPLSGAVDLSESQARAAGGEVEAAFTDASTAASAQPYAASPPLQQALLLERAGNLPAAVEAAREATRAEPTNWRTWFVRSRIEAEAGDARAAVESLRQARQLNPNSASIATADALAEQQIAADQPLGTQGGTP